MNKGVKLSNEEQAALMQLSNEQLQALRDLRETKAFLAMHALVNVLIDYEKNYLFSINEAGITPVVLSQKHAYSRGTCGAGAKILRLITASQAELSRREQAKKKQQAAAADGEVKEAR